SIRDRSARAVFRTQRPRDSRRLGLRARLQLFPPRRDRAGRSQACQAGQCVERAGDAGGCDDRIAGTSRAAGSRGEERMSLAIALDRDDDEDCILIVEHPQPEGDSYEIVADQRVMLVLTCGADARPGVAKTKLEHRHVCSLRWWWPRQALAADMPLGDVRGELAHAVGERSRPRLQD